MKKLFPNMYNHNSKTLEEVAVKCQAKIAPKNQQEMLIILSVMKNKSDLIFNKVK